MKHIWDFFKKMAITGTKSSVYNPNNIRIRYGQYGQYDQGSIGGVLRGHIEKNQYDQWRLEVTKPPLAVFSNIT